MPVTFGENTEYEVRSMKRKNKKARPVISTATNYDDRRIERKNEGRYKVYGYKSKEKTMAGAKQMGQKDGKYVCDYTAKCGVVKQDFDPLNSQSGKQIFVGSRGGYYYVNAKGNRVYVTNNVTIKKQLPN